MLRIGAVGTLAWGDEPRTRTQRWGRRAYEQYTQLDGIRYRAAHQGGESVVLWERAGALVALPGGDQSLRTVWNWVAAALEPQGRTPARLAAQGCPACREAGYA